MPVHIDLMLTLTGLLVGALVGVTGMGGGALLTPLLVLVFGVPPLAAVSSDLVTSLVMKPVGAAVHLRRGTVNRRLVGLLAMGSVPAAFAGAVAIGLSGRGADFQVVVRLCIAAALFAAVGASLARLWLDRRRGPAGDGDAPIALRAGRTIAIGALAGFGVGVSSVGAGSLVISMLLLAYPRLKPGQLVGTDLVQAIPLVAAAAAGHLLFGDVRLAVTGSLLVGALPGVYAGARLSAWARSGFIRPTLAGVLTASAIALLHAPAAALVAGAVGAAAAVAALQSRPVAALAARRRSEALSAP